VRWTTAAALRPVFECHCHRCRRLTGDHIAATAVPTDSLIVSSSDTSDLRWYSPADDANVAYGFCGACGATLFHCSGIDDGTNEITSIAIGSFDDDPDLTTSEIWFCDEARSHVRLPAADSGIVLHPGDGRSPHDRPAG
jgi:hypothetical protein